MIGTASVARAVPNHREARQGVPRVDGLALRGIFFGVILSLLLWLGIGVLLWSL